MKFLLDTNICIAYLHRLDTTVSAKLQEHSYSDFALCSIVKSELAYGARKSQRVNENLATLEKFFSLFESLPFDDQAAQHYGLHCAALQRAGTPIGANDLMIASIALAHELVLVTRNRGEFSRVTGLKMVAW